MYQIRINHPLENQRIYLRDICGGDELSVSSDKSTDAIRLIDQLMVLPAQENKSVSLAADLTVSDRDFVLAAIYQRIFGSKIESTIHCEKCKEPIDLDFALPQLVGHLTSELQNKTAWYQEDGTYMTEDKLHFRLPTGNDEYTISGIPADQAREKLLNSCVLSEGENYSIEQLETAIEKIAPFIETKLAAICPDCDARQDIHFSIQAFLLNSLLLQQKRVSYEIHQIASNYKWSHQEILDLPRTMRKTYVNFIEIENDRI
jgi:hypothetical protein